MRSKFATRACWVLTIARPESITALLTSTITGPTCPSLRDQHQRMEERFTAPFTVLRSLTPLKMSYEVGKKTAEPYTKIVEELPEMRRDTLELVKKAIGEKRRAYVLVNNRSEWNAPLTIQALRTALQASETSALPLSIFGLSWQRELEGVEDATAFAARAESGGVNVGPAHGSLDRLVQVCNSGFATHQNPAPSQPPRINVAPDLKYSPYRNFMASFATNLSTNTGL